MESFSLCHFLKCLYHECKRLQNSKLALVDSQITAFFCYIPVVGSRQMALGPHFQEKELNHSPKEHGDPDDFF